MILSAESRSISTSFPGDFEIFASPLNAAVPNGRFSSKWPHVEWRFGSIGSLGAERYMDDFPWSLATKF